jgi:hypothetical protein
MKQISLLIAVVFIVLTNLLMYPTTSKGGNCVRCVLAPIPGQGTAWQCWSLQESGADFCEVNGDGTKCNMFGICHSGGGDSGNPGGEDEECDGTAFQPIWCE